MEPTPGGLHEWTEELVQLVWSHIENNAKISRVSYELFKLGAYPAYAVLPTLWMQKSFRETWMGAVEAVDNRTSRAVSVVSATESLVRTAFPTAEGHLAMQGVRLAAALLLAYTSLLNHWSLKIDVQLHIRLKFDEAAKFSF